MIFPRFSSALAHFLITFYFNKLLPRLDQVVGISEGKFWIHRSKIYFFKSFITKILTIQKFNYNAEK